ncbi:MAG: GNAT family N-acetyltransferase [Candidatus Cyclobacteriaceae bacterium M3_2C_046]
MYRENDRIIGAGGINYFYHQGLTRLSWDLVHPNYHERGIGTSLVQYRLEIIKTNPLIKKVQVRTSQLTYGFYEKMGFRLEKTEKNSWADGFDLYQMVMSI